MCVFVVDVLRHTMAIGEILCCWTFSILKVRFHLFERKHILHMHVFFDDLNSSYNAHVLDTGRMTQRPD